MNRTNTMLTIAGALALGAAPGAALAQMGIPARPEEIHFSALEFEPPMALDYRYETSGGVPVYMMPSHEFPLINITFSFKGGEYLETPDKVGLANMTGSMLRRGGTASMSASDLDEELDFLAAQVRTFAGGQRSGASLNSLASNFDDTFALFIDMLRNPGFQADKVELYRDEMLEQMKQRNDDAGPILNREWDAMLYGRDSWQARVPTEATLNAITTSDMREFHDKIFNPGNLIIGVTGDFDPDQMLARINKALAGWQAGPRNPDAPDNHASFNPGVYHVEKDIPQGKVAIGQRGVKRDDPDYFALRIMNDVLGGSGFTSRITKKVRSDEGLAYSAGSRFSMPAEQDGEFMAFYQSKNRTVALAAKLIFDEIDKIRTAPISEQELETSKASIIETFPRTFESKNATVNLFIDDEWTKRPRGYWQSFRDNVRAVTANDVLRVAREHLDPDKMVMMVVGNWGEIEGGDLEDRADMSDIFGGSNTELPLRDPLSQKPIQN
ncbi:MAG: insulinase family protein [Phycisphaeraceae bacterium]|nr:insulinase family protein [Phycisphaeraceae bacterium]